MPDKDKSILLIEDNADDELLTLRALKKLKYSRIIVIRSGPEAIDYLFCDQNNNLSYNRQAQAVKKPHIVLLDLNLPAIDGLTILKKIRSDKRTKNIPVIVLTSSGEEKDIEESYRYGANSYIRKPVDFLEFEKTASLIGEYWLRLNIGHSQTGY